jgi:hypothetical protein
MFLPWSQLKKSRPSEHAIMAALLFFTYQTPSQTLPYPQNQTSHDVIQQPVGRPLPVLISP